MTVVNPYLTGAEVRGGFDRLDVVELTVCRSLNRAVRYEIVRQFFDVVSRLGDGIFWYALIAITPIIAYGNGWLIAGQMAATALPGVAVYKLLKTRLVRERPFIAHANIVCGTPPLDRYSFPSGHTLHATSFAVMRHHHFPELTWAVAPFAVLVALSRPILGLHYPTDVLAGAVVGAGLAYSSLYAFGF